MTAADPLAPLADTAWTEERAAHLFNRAGFGASPDTLRRAAKRDLRAVVDELVDYEQIPDPFDPPTWINADAALRLDRQLAGLTEEQRRVKRQELRQQEQARMRELRAWWLYRMRFTKRPLQEKLTLFWHGHFATSFEKVRSAYCMYRQNETLRRLASGSWASLVTAIAQDPAMLIYLDNAQSRRGNPNENFARELMELFTIGEGHYTEEDIKESARAFTGWTLDRERFEFLDQRRQHDDGAKVFFRQRGNFNGHDIIKILLATPESARFIVRKLWTFFAYEEPEAQIVDALAEDFRRTPEIRPLMRRIFMSHAFYRERAVGTQVKSPVEWLLSASITLEGTLPGPTPCAIMLNALGQELFAPPNVKGWDGGLSWISTSRLFHRYNSAALLLRGGRGVTALKGLPELGTMRGMTAVLDPAKIRHADIRGSRESTRQALQFRLYGRSLRPQDESALKAYFETLPEPAQWTNDTVLDALQHMMSTPQYQLC